MWPLHDDDMSALADMLAPVTTLAASVDDAQRTLFDDLEDEDHAASDLDDRAGDPSDHGDATPPSD